MITLRASKALRSTLTQDEETIDKSALELYLEDRFVPLSKQSRDKLTRSKSVPAQDGIKAIPSPAELYDTDPLFPGYVEERIRWATGGGGTLMVQRTKAVNAICKFATPKFGWYDYRERMMHGRPSEGTKPTSPEEESDDGYRRQISDYLSRT